MIYNVIVKSNNSYYSYDSLGGWLEINEPQDEQDYIDYGFNMDLLPDVTKEQWAELSDISILFFTDDPEVEEITIETETEEFTIYDEFGDSMEVVYYTDDENVEEAELEIVANYSPLDELEGDFEVVTWTDNNDEDTKLKLETRALPNPQFIYQTTPYNIKGYLQEYVIEQKEISNLDGEVKYLFSPNKQDWYTWNGSHFIKLDGDSIETVYSQGLSLPEIEKIEDEEWELWGHDSIYLGIYLDENIRGGNEIEIERISVKDLAPVETTKVSDVKMYILNTVSTIEVVFENKILKGSIDDADKSKVQYRIILNGQPFYPSDGSFTSFAPSPLNITTTFTNEDIRLGEMNTLRIEFHDYWGSTDYWETSFIGEYSGLMFIDESGEYYTTDIGEILKYLDFGIIIAGQTTVENKIVIRNTYNYDVKNVRVGANTSDFPMGMKLEFSKSNTPFIPEEELNFNETVKQGEEIEFYVRMKTELGVTPPNSGEFNIYAVAEKIND